MNRLLCIFCLLLIFAGCKEKLTAEDQKQLRHALQAEVPKDQVREFLTEYGQER